MTEGSIEIEKKPEPQSSEIEPQSSEVEVNELLKVKKESKKEIPLTKKIQTKTPTEETIKKSGIKIEDEAKIEAKKKKETREKVEKILKNFIENAEKELKKELSKNQIDELLGMAITSKTKIEEILMDNPTLEKELNETSKEITEKLINPLTGAEIITQKCFFIFNEKIVEFNDKTKMEKKEFEEIIKYTLASLLTHGRALEINENERIKTVKR
ncbi:hypothetical protein BWK69_00745 [Candidatus Parcubacteria bacterium A4]|nr:MAG: hypothetical protein BWK69_00745 [Candidatus Parcubacteria bacterium A4]